MTDLPLPRVIPARPNGDWRDPERSHNMPSNYTAADFPIGDCEPPLPTLPEAALTDKLRQIAMLLRSLTVEEMWTLVEGMKRPDLDKTLIAWAKHYMDPDANPAPQADGRRA